MANVIAYSSNWANAVQAAGYRPGIYVGSKALLITSNQLFRTTVFALLESWWQHPSCCDAGLPNDTKYCQQAKATRNGK
jgi:glycoside hydrolase-like protein